MNLRSEILQARTPSQIRQLSNYVAADSARFNTFMALFLGHDVRVTQSASRVLIDCAQHSPERLSPYLKPMLEQLKLSDNDTVKRNVLRVLQDVELPQNLHGMAVTLCMEQLLSVTAPIAVKAFSMTVVANLVPLYPELIPELRTVIETLMEQGSPGILSRGKKVLKTISKRPSETNFRLN